MGNQLVVTAIRVAANEILQELWPGETCNDHQILFCAFKGGIIQQGNLHYLEALFPSELDAIFRWLNKDLGEIRARKSQFH